MVTPPTSSPHPQSVRADSNEKENPLGLLLWTAQGLSMRENKMKFTCALLLFVNHRAYEHAYQTLFVELALW